MSADLSNAIHDHRRDVRSAICDITDVANSLYDVGLDRAADNLMNAIRGLDSSAARIVNLHTDDMHDQIAHSDTIMRGVVSLAMSGKLDL